MILLERSYSFSASHLYWRREWSAGRNFEVFGKCSIRPAHGHNYRLTVRVRGLADPETGYLIDLAALDQIVRSAVVERLDHRHINSALAEFGEGGRIPTTENLVQWVAAEISEQLPPGNRLEELRLEEDDRLASLWRSEEV